MGESVSKAGQIEGQIEEEQRSLDAMYARLDADLSARIAARDRALARPVEGPEELSARDFEVSRLADGIRQLRVGERSLCFGRIDGVQAGESWHVGRIGLRTDEGEPLLLDWRAEAARPFYAATMAAPLGLRRRRHLRTDGRTVIDVSDEILDGTDPIAGDVVGDGPLVAALSGARTGRMREAAATLQSEQDEIVRSPHRGIMVVDGGPGTGKTIVALHRAAYVLYAFPSVAERGVMVFGPNRRFLAYISDVLPSLGENDVQLATLPDLVGAEATRGEPDAIARIKGRAQLADGLARWVRARQPDDVPLELQTAHGTVVLDPGLVDAARRHALQGGVGHNRARELFLEHVVEELVNELEQQTTKEVSDFEAEIEAFLGIDLDRMVAGDLRRAGSGGADANANADADADGGAGGGGASAGGLDIDWDRIREDLLGDPAIDRIVDRVWPRLRAEDAVRGLLADRAALAEALPDVPEADLALLAGPGRAGLSAWTEADLAVLDEARALIDGLPESAYGHIVVDEAQQLSEMQWRMLMRRCPQRSMTIVGDLAQAGPVTSIRTWREALEPFVGERYARHTLTVNYRTTAEILQTTEDLLARIAPEQRLSRSIRHGEQPAVVTIAAEDTDGDTAENTASVLRELIERTREAHPDGLIGVVVPERRSAALGAEIGETDVTILAAPDARGLEFDTVIIVDPDGIRSAGEAGLRDLYVAQTRATTRLLILEVASPAGLTGSTPD
ncbi:DNA helicase IV [Microbacterium resistens]|uniref:DNA helicase IV n=1 Tax=Microbacterium resistens TaxID=156977 RepID=A0ABU1SE74_9MICO|nr:AAA family ATPase [Microbacterium resistens]MDR6867901.1 DNA helicase IV [Microbacterium resistens]